MKISLQKSFFGETKKELLQYGEFKINTLRYTSGVEALEIINSKCSFIFTPFKGQQIWHFTVNGEEISMLTTVKEPQDTTVYLENYGGFLYHCGLISFGAPDEIHPHHGELPNAQYKNCFIMCEEDEKGKFIILGGETEHNTAFIRGYKFSPQIKLYENECIFKINVCIENMRSYSLEYMYLCHLNFKPINGAKLIYNAENDVIIYPTAESEVMNKYKLKLQENPRIMDNIGNKDEMYDPEICFGIKYIPDKDGRAHTLQYAENGACYVSHPVEELPYGIRWISRTKQEDSLGMVLPATAEHLGYKNAIEKAQIKTVNPNEKLEFYLEAGFLFKDEADKMKEYIENY